MVKLHKTLHKDFLWPWLCGEKDSFLNGGWMLVFVMLTCLNKKSPGGDDGSWEGSE